MFINTPLNRNGSQQCCLTINQFCSGQETNTFFFIERIKDGGELGLGLKFCIYFSFVVWHDHRCSAEEKQQPRSLESGYFVTSFCKTRIWHYLYCLTYIHYIQVIQRTCRRPGSSQVLKQYEINIKVLIIPFNNS